MTRIALLSTSDTDLLSARASGADYLWANPSKAAHTELAEALDRCDLVVVRLLGSPKDLCSGFERFRAAGKPMVVVGGEQTARRGPDGAVDRPPRGRRRGPPLPRPGRPRQPRSAARLRVRHRAAHRRRVRAARRAAQLGCAAPTGPPELRGDDSPGRASSSTGPSSPPATPPTSRRSPMPSTRGAAKASRSTPPRCAMPRRSARTPRHPRRVDHHRARRRGHPAGDGVGGRARTRAGTCGRLRPSTSRWCRDSA